MSAWVEQILSYDLHGNQVGSLEKPDLRETEYEWKNVAYAPTPMGRKKMRITGFSQLNIKVMRPDLREKLGVETSSAYDPRIALVFFGSSIRFLCTNPVVEVFDRETDEWDEVRLNDHFSESFLKQLQKLSAIPRATLHVFWINP